jgi:crotonobetainyl-CoA:carnitine CoA-transferase CaiB-like acyl-CoA transferase
VQENSVVAGPLNGVRVLELGMMYAGPFGGKVLADLGAEVVHVEDPIKGDPARHWQPQVGGFNVGFARVNCLKKSLAVNLRSPEGQDLIRAIVPRFDVVLTNLRVSALTRWGIGPERLKAIKPDLVVTTVSGYGSYGPRKDRPGFGTIADGVSGFAFTNGWPDTPPTTAPFGLSDCMAGITAALGTLAALVGLGKSGTVPGDVDVAIYEPLLAVMGDELAEYSAVGTFRGRKGNAVQASSPRGVFQCRDGEWVVISGSSQNACTRLFAAIGHPGLIEDPRYATNAMRVKNDADLMVLIAGWVRQRDRAEVLALMDGADVPVGPVNSPADIVEDSDLWERGSLAKLEIPGADHSITVPGRYVRLSNLEPITYSAPPRLGQHTSDLLASDADLTPAEISKLAAAGVIAVDTA